MVTLTYCKGLPTPASELNPLGFTSLEMFLAEYSSIFHQAASETANHLLWDNEFNKSQWNRYLQQTYGINKRHAMGRYRSRWVLPLTFACHPDITKPAPIRVLFGKRV
ncbi:hypothetical protein [Coleofasciculus sp. E1-EBD-02]|uniref:hypothetical protein n=1 Tax=Coleofasciculus sp. E1-EBD-02 TaxID=3068481 RepID=UPI00330423EF